MRTTIIAIAVMLLAVLAAVLYHLRTVDSWADRLRAEQAAHTQTRQSGRWQPCRTTPRITRRCYT